ncbi:ATP-binding protein, partial [Jinshanibacter sp. LJY008]
WNDRFGSHHSFQNSGDKLHQSLPSIIQRAKNTTTLNMRHDPMKQCEISNKKANIIKFLNAADMNIDDISITKKSLLDTEEYNKLSDELKNIVKKNKILEEEVFDADFIRKNKNNVEVSLNIDYESDGTRKLFSLAGPWLDTLENGYTLVIDELHDKLHPLLLRYMVVTQI